MNTWVKLTAIFVPLAALGGWILAEGSARDARMTAETKAVLDEVKLQKDTESSSLDETQVTFRFQLAGRQVQASDTLPGDRTAELKPGQQVTVCYNPSDPGESAVRLRVEATCGT